MEYNQAKALLEGIGEGQLLSHWASLSTTEQKELLAQISTIDLPLLKAQKQLLTQPLTPPSTFTPFVDYFLKGQQADFQKGKELIAAGKVGCLIIAGGQGTRLNFDGPKGMFPISPVKGKSLFQIFAEKTLAAGKQANRVLPLAIMTSPQNHAETVHFFEKHHNFGLESSQLSFFVQGELPFLDKSGHLFLETPYKIAFGPDGNGSSLHCFYNKGPGKQWETAGIEYIHYVVIDNPLADPFDAECVGHHAHHKNEITVKCTHKLNPEEKVGVLGYQDGKLTVVEYSELPEKEQQAKHPDGTLVFGCANISLFCFSLPFIRKIAAIPAVQFPLHQAFKAAKYISEDGITVQSNKPIAWKFERFIFDLLPYAEHITALLYPRETCFAPLKNGIGPDSPESVKKLLQAYDRKTFYNITACSAEQEPFELDQQFHYPTASLLEKWKGRPSSSFYVER